MDDCRAYRQESPRFNMTFGQLCNGIVEFVSDVTNDTDESNCLMNEWPCSTYYSACNTVWNCPDGSDELGTCQGTSPSSFNCNSTNHFCLDIHTGDPICLSKARVGDSIIDCVGSIDEQEFCRINYSDKQTHRFRCQNSNVCIPRIEICDCHQNCPENDDETIACHWLNNGQATMFNPDKFRCRNGRNVSYGN